MFSERLNLKPFPKPWSKWSKNGQKQSFSFIFWFWSSFSEGHFHIFRNRPKSVPIDPELHQQSFKWQNLVLRRDISESKTKNILSPMFGNPWNLTPSSPLAHQWLRLYKVLYSRSENTILVKWAQLLSKWAQTRDNGPHSPHMGIPGPVGPNTDPNAKNIFSDFSPFICLVHYTR